MAKKSIMLSLRGGNIGPQGTARWLNRSATCPSGNVRYLSGLPRASATALGQSGQIEVEHGDQAPQFDASSAQT